MRRLVLFLSLVAFSFCIFAEKEIPHLLRQGTATRFIVDGKPFLIIAGELGNSSASSINDIERIFPKLQQAGLNTVLVPAYWDLLEPKEGTFDFTLTDKAIMEARKNNLRIVFLWFGAWKNSMSCYAPEWFKTDFKKYPRAHAKNGEPLEIASAFSDNVFQADNRAFSEFMKHIAQIDGNDRTVIMVQIENEIGMLEGPRDYSEIANKLYDSEVPSTLVDFLKKNEQSLHPDMLKKWKENGSKTRGKWIEVFGNDIYSEEMFTAWNYARYVEKMAKTARSIYSIPLYVNAAMNSRNRKPGEYPSGGPLAHLIDIWHCAAPSIDFLSPDLYDLNFQELVSRYKRINNPLFIPEIRLEDNDGVRAFFVYGEYDAMGFSPFSIEDISESDHPSLIKAYSKLKELSPLILKMQGQGKMNGLLFNHENKERILFTDEYKLICRHYYTLPWDPRATDGTKWPEGGGVIIRLSKNEFVIAGSGIVVTFERKESASIMDNKNIGEDGFVQSGGNQLNKNQWGNQSKVGIVAVDEVHVLPDCTLKYVRRLNGDQDHQGRHVRIPIGDFSILYVKLYEFK